MHCDKPTESIWSVLKRSLANLVKHNVSELTALAKTRLRRMQYRPGLLAGTRLDLTPFCNLRIEDRLVTRWPGWKYPFGL